ncbi:MAG: 6-phosphofructokinase [Chloroflexi bacterium]|nr:6-phosphofructokinase [Chloroflexota bacterium]
MEKIGILTSGGDAPGMNACIRAAVRSAEIQGIQVVGIMRGYAGLIVGDLAPVDRRGVANIIQRGGTILETARCEEFKAREGRAKAFAVMQEHGIEGLIAIGGDGTFRGAKSFADEFPVKVVGVPATIDNDVPGTDYTIGFDTAVNTALEAIDRIRDTAFSHERLFFVEVMGRQSGFIALEVGLAGGAEAILVPEIPTDIETLCHQLDHSFRSGKRSSIIVVAEGDKAGGAFSIANKVRERIKMESRVCVLGHIQRGGTPTARDRILASKLGVAAVEALLKGQDGCMVGEVKGDVICTPLSTSWTGAKTLDGYLIHLLDLLAH